MIAALVNSSVNLIVEESASVTSQKPRRETPPSLSRAWTERTPSASNVNWAELVVVWRTSPPFMYQSYPSAASAETSVAPAVNHVGEPWSAWRAVGLSSVPDGDVRTGGTFVTETAIVIGSV